MLWVRLQTSEKPYLTRVEEPISGCDIYDAIHAWGMSQRGAIRWAKGNQCAGSGNQPWPVRWTDYRQILAHYYTGIDFLDGSGVEFAPDDRWNLLHHDAPASRPLPTLRICYLFRVVFIFHSTREILQGEADIAMLQGLVFLVGRVFLDKRPEITVAIAYPEFTKARGVFTDVQGDFDIQIGRAHV